MEPSIQVPTRETQPQIKKALEEVTISAAQRYKYHTNAAREWIHTLEESQYKRSLDKLRSLPAIFQEIQHRYPDAIISNATQADQVYWKASQEAIRGDDKSLFECNLDDNTMNFLPTMNTVMYRVIVALTPDHKVLTVFPYEDTRVKMSQDPAVEVDLQKKRTCVIGQIPDEKFLILIKLHYFIQPQGECFKEGFQGGEGVSLLRELLQKMAHLLVFVFLIGLVYGAIHPRIGASYLRPWQSLWSRWIVRQ